MKIIKLKKAKDFYKSKFVLKIMPIFNWIPISIFFIMFLTLGTALFL